MIHDCFYICDSLVVNDNKNTSVPSLSDPLTLALSILILFYLSVFFLFKAAVRKFFGLKLSENNIWEST